MQNCVSPYFADKFWDTLPVIKITEIVWQDQSDQFGTLLCLVGDGCIPFTLLAFSCPPIKVNFYFCWLTRVSKVVAIGGGHNFLGICLGSFMISRPILSSWHWLGFVYTECCHDVNFQCDKTALGLCSWRHFYTCTTQTTWSVVFVTSTTFLLHHVD